MDDSHHLTLDNASQAWETLAERVDSLIAAWEASDEPPDLQALAADVPAELRRIVLVELIKADLEHRWERPQFRQGVDIYFEQFPELTSDGNVPCDLLFEEYHIRLRAGDRVDPATYFERYPAQAGELKRLLEIGTDNQSTRLLASASPDLVCAGDRLDDFDLVAPLGKGAFASVFLARQRSMQRLVALKISSDQGDEPQTLAQLDHPNIVRVYDQRVLADRKMRLLYMQLVPGGTLQAVNDTLRAIPPSDWSGSRYIDSVDESLGRTGHAPSAESSIRRRLEAASWGEAVAWIGARLAAALDYAHRMGVLHRDVKPANVLLDAEGSPKLADFNISFCSKVEGATPAAFFGGSLAYMSPEQLEAYNPAHQRTPDSIDARSDVYSLAVVLWELLCGQRPFGDERMQDSWPETLEQMTARRRAGVDPQPNWRPPPGCPAGLDEILLKCLAPDPEARWQSAAEVATQLELCLQPEVRELVQIRPGSWRDRVRRMPIQVVMLVTLQPNVLAAMFNYYYNLVELAARLEAQHLLWQLQLVINGIVFPLGISVGIYLIWPVARGLRARERLEAEHAAWLRQRTLRLGHYVALIGIVLWLVAAPAYPICFSLLGVGMQWEEYVHFMSSLTISGLIAAAYPFFFVSFLSTRVFFPALLRPEEATQKDVAALHQLGRLSYVYLYLAGAVPGLGVLLLALIESKSQPALVILSAGGVLCFPIALLLYRAIQRDLDRLVVAVGQPAGGSRKPPA